MKTIVNFLLLSLIAVNLSAIDETKMDTIYESEIRPYIEANATDGQFVVADGTSLSYRAIVNSDARIIVVILGGHTESYVKYSELLYDFRDVAVSIYALDQRGQGFSTRALPDREKDHVEDYNSFITDLDHFIRTVIKPGEEKTVLLLGSSFGGAVAAAYAERYPDIVDGLIMSSPNPSLKAPPIALAFVSILNCLGGARQYAPGGGPFKIEEFEGNKETHSRARHERKVQDYLDYPEIRLGYPTNHWLMELEKLGREAVKNASKISCPTIAFQAELDEYANRRAQDALIAGIAQCRSLVLENAFHELLIETDVIREKVLSEIRGFVTRNFL